MNGTVNEWVAKAEGDFRVAKREVTEASEPFYDAVCFHAQQCIEKYMKAALIKSGNVPPRVHDLVVLSNLLTGIYSEWDWPVEELRFLTLAAISFRYPGESAEEEDARKAVEICSRIKEKLSKLFV